MSISKFTFDASLPQHLRFYAVEKLGDKQSLTPEGFLIVEDVPIARTGTMVYGPNEVPITPGLDGLVHVERNEDEVFRPEYIASYVGKSLANDHPPVDVDPSNWKEYEVGQVLNPRRGTGLQGDLLLADFIIKCPIAIAEVRAGKREVSCGYDADYVEISRGRGKQTNMIGNHVALVESGRCGPRCAIGDKRTIKEEDMKFKDEASAKFKDSKIGKLILGAFSAKDATELQTFLDAAAQIRTADDDSVSGNHIHVHAGGQAGASKFTDEDHQAFRDSCNARLAALEGKTNDDMTDDAKAMADAAAAEKAVKDAADFALDAELKAEAPTADAAVKSRDSAFLEESFQDTVALAEILSPGIRIPTFDRAAAPKDGLDVVCQLRRNALDAAYGGADREMITAMNGGELNLAGMRCNQVRTLFRSAATAKRLQTNARQTSDRGLEIPQSQVKRAPTIAEVNARNAQHYGIK